MANDDSAAELRRKLENLLGYPRGAFDPGSNFLRDKERINKALGAGFLLFQDIISPPALRARLEAFHPDQAVLRKALGDILNLPRKMFEFRLPPNGRN